MTAPAQAEPRSTIRRSRLFARDRLKPPARDREVERLVDAAVAEARAEVPRRGVIEAAGEHHGAVEDVADAVDLDPAARRMRVALQQIRELAEGDAEALGIAGSRAGDEAGLAMLPERRAGVVRRARRQVDEEHHPRQRFVVVDADG